MADALTRIKRQAGHYYLAAAIATAVVGFMFGTLGGIRGIDGVTCGAVSFLFLTFEAIVLRRGLARNTRSSGELCDRLGAANLITLLRGWLIAVLAGVLTLQGSGALPAGGTFVAWVPAVLYTVVMILDAVDGFVARRTGSVSELGRLLENEYDPLGVLVIALFLSVTGRVFPVIAFAGAARYLFVWGLWVRKRLGLQTHPLVHTNSGKIIAGFMMGYLSAGLWPLFSSRYLSIAGVVFLVPFAAGFLRDWLAVCGTIDLRAPAYRRAAERFVTAVLEIAPVFLRAISAGLLVWLATMAETPAVLAFVAAGLLILGVGGRIVAVATAAVIAAGTANPGPDVALGPAAAGVEITLFVVVLLIALTGTGRFSLWQPEVSIFRQRGVVS